MSESEKGNNPQDQSEANLAKIGREAYRGRPIPLSAIGYGSQDSFAKLAHDLSQSPGEVSPENPRIIRIADVPDDLYKSPTTVNITHADSREGVIEGRIIEANGLREEGWLITTFEIHPDTSKFSSGLLGGMVFLGPTPLPSDDEIANITHSVQSPQKPQFEPEKQQFVLELARYVHNSLARANERTISLPLDPPPNAPN